MVPKLFEIPLGFFTIPINSYGVMVLAGFMAGIWVAGRRARARGLPPELVSDLAVWLLFGGLVGARIVYVAFYNRGEYDFRLFDLTDGGLHPLGALAGIGAAAFFVWRRRRAGDAAAPARAQKGSDTAAQSEIHNPQSTIDAPRLGPRSVIAGVLLLLASGLAGARVLHLWLNRGSYNFKVFAIWEGGIVFYGGLIGALACGLYFLRRRKVPVLATADIVAPSLALGMVFGRLGCFLKGCCYGGRTDGPCGVAFPRIVETAMRDGRIELETTGSPAYLDHLNDKLIPPGATQSLPVHPAQLYESAAMVALFILLSAYGRRSPRPGRVLAATGVGYGLWRFGVEFLRGDPHPVWGGLHFSQLVSLGVVAAGAALWASRR